jgi:hypothetical protein
MNLQTLPEAPNYEALLKASMPNSFDIALYPPVPQAHFDVGTVFSSFGNGSIRTYVGAPYNMLLSFIRLLKREE